MGITFTPEELGATPELSFTPEELGQTPVWRSRARREGWVRDIMRSSMGKRAKGGLAAVIDVVGAAEDLGEIISTLSPGSIAIGELDSGVLGHSSEDREAQRQRLRDINEGVGMFGKFVSGILNSAARDPLGSAKKLPVLAAGLVQGIVEPLLKYPIDFATGVDTKWVSMPGMPGGVGLAPSGAPPLDPEDLRQRARDFLANAIGWVAGAKAEIEIAKTLTGVPQVVGRKTSEQLFKAKNLKQMSDILTDRVAPDDIPKLMDLAKTGTLPTWARHATAGAGGGIIGGGATGFVEGETVPESIAAGLSYAMIALPVGVAFGGIAGHYLARKGGGPDAISQAAAQLANQRQLSRVLDRTPFQILMLGENLEQSLDIAATVILDSIEFTNYVVNNSKGVLVPEGKGMGVVQGVKDPLRIVKLAKEREGMTAALHQRTDGTFDILVAPERQVPDVKFFEKTGYVEGEQVSYGGHDMWTIEDFGVPEGKRAYRMKLRNMVTDESVEGVLPKDIAKLQGEYFGDVTVMQKRIITEDDVLDYSQGWSKGGNALDKNSPGVTPYDFMQTVDSEMMAWTGYELATDAQGKLIATNRRSDVPRPDVVLKEGLNDLRFTEPPYKPTDPVLEMGAAVYIKNNEPYAVLAWDERMVHGQKVKGSQSFWSFSHGDEAIRRESTQALRDFRAQNKIWKSHSTLSVGGRESLVRMLNENMNLRRGVGVMPAPFVRTDPALIRQSLFQSFLDFIKWDGNDIKIDPDVVVNAMMNDFGEPTTAGKSITREQRIISEPATERPPRYFSETIGELDERQAIRLMRQQVEAGGGVPQQTRPPRADAIDSRNIAFNDMFATFAAKMGIRPEMQASFRNFFEFEFGRLLTGDPKVLKTYADKGFIPNIQARINSVNKTLQQLDKVTQSPLVEDFTRPHLTFEAWDQLDKLDKLPIIRELSEVMDVPMAASRDPTPEMLGDLRSHLTEARDVLGKRVEQLRNPPPPVISPDERAVYTRLMDEMKQTREKLANDLVHTANRNGFYVDRELDGTIILRDLETQQKMPTAFLDEDAAIGFINGSGKATDVIDLDRGGANTVPPGSIMSPLMPDPGQGPKPFEIPHQYLPDGKIAKLKHTIAVSATRLTPKREFFVGLDALFGTTLTKDVYYPLQVAKMNLDAKKHPFLSMVQEVESSVDKLKLTPEQRNRISEYRETMSREDVIDKLFRTRKLTQIEIDAAEKLIANNVDVDKVYKYRRELFNIIEDSREAHARLNPDAPDFAQKAQAVENEARAKRDVLQKELLMDTAHLEAAGIFDEIIKQHPDQARLDAVTRLTKASQNKSMSRDAFAKHHKMSKAEVDIAHKIDAIYSSIAQDLGVPESYTQYLQHFADVKDVPGSGKSYLNFRPLTHSRDDVASEFAARLLRSGEINVYERDPIRALASYIHAGYNVRLLDPIYNAAQKAAVEQLKKIPRGQERAAFVTAEYLQDLRGIPAASDELAQAAVDKFLDGLDIAKGKENVSLRKDVVNVALSAGSGAMIGFRVMQGIRDFVSQGKIMYARFGREWYNDALSLAFKRDATGRMPVQYLAEEGLIPGLSPLSFMSEAEFLKAAAGNVASKAKSAIFKTSALGFEMSGQHNVYSLTHAMGYLKTMKDATALLHKLGRNEITKKQLWKDLKLDSYDLPIQQAFDDFVIRERFGEAAKFLAHSTGAEMAFIYGIANHPFGWSSGFGKVASQFGTWPMWDRNFLHRLAGRGTVADRAAAMARLASAEAATFLAGATTGLNMRSWYLIPGILFGGGPYLGMLEQVEEMMGLRGKNRQRQALSIHSGKIPIISQMVPGAYAFSDYFQAYQLHQKNYGAVPVLGKGLGFAVDRSQRSFLDELIGQYPQQTK